MILQEILSLISGFKHLIGLNLTFLIEGNLCLSMDSILTMLYLNLEFPKPLYLDQFFSWIYINDLNHAVNTGERTIFNCSTKGLNRLVNLDMKHLSICLHVNKIYLTIHQTELVIFKQNIKIVDHEVKIKLYTKRLCPPPSVKYLGI